MHKFPSLFWTDSFLLNPQIWMSFNPVGDSAESGIREACDPSCTKGTAREQNERATKEARQRWEFIIIIMHYPIVTTEGIIIAKQNYREANQLITFYTHKFGKMQVIAQGVRLGPAKLRPRLGLYTLGTFSFVLGKSGYRIVDVEEIKSLASLLPNLKRLRLYADVATLLNRLIQGEGANEVIWQKVKGLLLYLSGDACDDEKLREIEIKTVFHILKELGYVGNDKGKISTKDLREALGKAIEASQL